MLFHWTDHLYVIQTNAQRGCHWKGRQNKFSRIYCSYNDIFTVLTFRWCSKFPIDHYNKRFLLWIDFCGIMNCDTSSVAPSTINSNVTNMLFHWKLIRFCIWGTVYWKKWVFQMLFSNFFVLKNTFHWMHSMNSFILKMSLLNSRSLITPKIHLQVYKN